jgi:hypothetical protein
MRVHRPRMETLSVQIGTSQNRCCPYSMQHLDFLFCPWFHIGPRQLDLASPVGGHPRPPPAAARHRHDLSGSTRCRSDAASPWLRLPPPPWLRTPPPEHETSPALPARCLDADLLGSAPPLPTSSSPLGTHNSGIWWVSCSKSCHPLEPNLHLAPTGIAAATTMAPDGFTVPEACPSTAPSDAPSKSATADAQPTATWLNIQMPHPNLLMLPPC